MASSIGKETINTFSGGMNADMDVSVMKQDQYRYAENARIAMNDSSTFGALSVIEEPIELSTIDFIGYDIKGSATVRDTGVVFANETTFGEIFRLRFDGENLEKVLIFSSTHTFSDGISIVLIYEDSDNIKAYFAEEGEPIRVINISSSADSYNGSISDIDKFSFTPPALLEKPTIIGTSTGGLMSGRYQYAYRLYSKYGTESAVSSFSSAVDLFSSSITTLSSGVLGSNQGDNSGKSISIKIPYDSTFSNIRIISIFYESTTSEPVVKIVSDDKFVDNSGYHYFMDSGSSTVDDLTVSELNQISLNTFSARYLESKDNILFAADIEKNEFVVDDYDTRAFAFKKDGIIYKAELYNADLLSKIDVYGYELATKVIPEDADCINKEIYIEERYSTIEHKYDTQGNLGGEGKHVKYNFINTYFVESYGNYLDKPEPLTRTNRYIDDRIARIGDKIHSNLSTIAIKSSTGTISEPSLNSFGISTHDGYLNYANPLLSEAFRSYHRDEIYRFAAVFYDNLGRKSEAKWIADIRFPANYEKDANWSASSFEMPSEIDDDIYDNNMSFSGVTLSNQELLVKPLGLSFTFSDIPTNIKKIEIVRSKRDLNNRTIIAQGVTQKTGTKYIEYSDTDVEFLRGENGTLRPHPILAMGYSYSSLGPFVPKIDAAAGYFSRYLSFSDIHSVARTSTNPAISDNDIRLNLRYTDHALAPYYSHRNYFMLISPEFSYLKDEYVSSIKQVYSNFNLVLSDIIYPKSTQSLLFLGTAVGVDSGALYHGSSLMLNAQFYSSSPTGWYPTSMYFTADLNENLVTSTNLFTTGLLGLPHSYIPLGATSTTDRTYTNSSPSNTQLYMDIHPTTATHYEVIGSMRSYISLGHHIEQRTTSLIDITPGSERLNRYPSVFNYSKTNTAFSATFKYFCNFNKNVGVAGSIGGDAISLLYQNSRSLSDIAISTVTKVGDIKSFNVSDFTYVPEIDGSAETGEAGILIESPSAKYTQVAGMSILNYHKGLTRGDSSSIYHGFTGDSMLYPSLMKTKVSGPHGDGVVFYVNDDNHIPSVVKLSLNRKKYISGDAYLGYKHIDEMGSSAMSTYVMNMKRMSVGIYGGISNSNRKYSEYISTGASILVDTNVEEIVNVFGGDTYIGIFDYTIIRASDPLLGSGIESGSKDGRGVSIPGTEMYQVGNVNALIPLETSINMRLSNSKSYITSGREAFIHELPGTYNPTTTSTPIDSTWASYLGYPQGTYPTSYTQTHKNHNYNSAYSAEKVANIFLSEVSDDDTTRKDCRVIASDKKTIDEVFDSWSIFRAANYIDVDTRYGKITRLKTFNNKLFFLQEDAIGVLSVNDRSLIQDNNIGELVLGTGEVLSRYDYVSTNNGLHKDAINSLATSPSGMYWYDHKRSEMCVFSKGTGSLSKAAGIQKILNKNGESIEMNIPIGYDRKYNELLITLSGLPSVRNQIK